MGGEETGKERCKNFKGVFNFFSGFRTRLIDIFTWNVRRKNEMGVSTLRPGRRWCNNQRGKEVTI
jgi:hypothetical protein